MPLSSPSLPSTKKLGVVFVVFLGAAVLAGIVSTPRGPGTRPEVVKFSEGRLCFAKQLVIHPLVAPTLCDPAAPELTLEERMAVRRGEIPASLQEKMAAVEESNRAAQVEWEQATRKHEQAKERSLNWVTGLQR